MSLGEATWEPAGRFRMRVQSLGFRAARMMRAMPARMANSARANPAYSHKISMIGSPDVCGEPIPGRAAPLDDCQRAARSVPGFDLVERADDHRLFGLDLDRIA